MSWVWNSASALVNSFAAATRALRAARTAFRRQLPKQLPRFSRAFAQVAERGRY